MLLHHPPAAIQPLGNLSTAAYSCIFTVAFQSELLLFVLRMRLWLCVYADAGFERLKNKAGWAMCLPFYRKTRVKTGAPGLESYTHESGMQKGDYK